MDYKVIYLKKDDVVIDFDFYFRFEKKHFDKYLPFSFIYSSNIYNSINSYYLFSGFSNFFSINDNNPYPFILVKDNIINLFFFHVEKNILENKINLAESIKISKLFKNLLKKYSIPEKKEIILKLSSFLNKIAYLKEIQKYEKIFTDKELSIFSKLNLRKKEIERYLKFKLLINNETLCLKYLTLIDKCNFNRNQFFNFFDKLYELIYIDHNINKEYFYKSILSKVKDSNLPLNLIHTKIFEMLNKQLYSPYLKKENKIKKFIKSIKTKNAQFEFTPYFEEKDFILKFNIKKPEDIENCFKDFDILKRHLKKLWEII